MSTDFSIDPAEVALEVTDEVVRSSQINGYLFIFLLGTLILLAFWILRKLSKQNEHLTSQLNSCPNLPDDVLYEVGSYLSPKDLVSLSGVSTNLNQVAKSGPLWMYWSTMHYPTVNKPRNWYKYYKQSYTGQKSSFFSELRNYDFRGTPTILLVSAVLVPICIAFLITITLHVPTPSRVSFSEFSSSNCSDFECLILFVVVLILCIVMLILPPILEKFVEPLFLNLGAKVGAKFKVDLENHRTTKVVLGSAVIATFLFLAIFILLVLNCVSVARLRYRDKMAAQYSKLTKIY
eukprot:TRINITY_DN15582_c0_g1_i2.p1 TRINITY_DN15582_c0_g1~~TRINITY_DN15582_c0_g1_i2.p1  ORF type:complete len:312 (-),score=52.19 TRINITY_DN15582_c0_g1_i2:133-1008(-)